MQELLRTPSQGYLRVKCPQELPFKVCLFIFTAVAITPGVFPFSFSEFIAPRCIALRHVFPIVLIYTDFEARNK